MLAGERTEDGCREVHFEILLYLDRPHYICVNVEVVLLRAREIM